MAQCDYENREQHHTDDSDDVDDYACSAEQAQIANSILEVQIRDHGLDIIAWQIMISAGLKDQCSEHRCHTRLVHTLV